MSDTLRDALKGFKQEIIDMSNRGAVSGGVLYVSFVMRRLNEILALAEPSGLRAALIKLIRVCLASSDLSLFEAIEEARESLGDDEEAQDAALAGKAPEPPKEKVERCSQCGKYIDWNEECYKALNSDDIMHWNEQGELCGPVESEDREP